MVAQSGDGRSGLGTRLLIPLTLYPGTLSSQLHLVTVTHPPQAASSTEAGQGDPVVCWHPGQGLL